jgi:hypothetical protein
MKSLAHIGILISVRTIKHEQAMRVVRKMRWHPIQDHANAFAVKCIYQCHALLRIAKP